MKWNFESPYSAVLKWSKTQDNCWEECKRKFYYQYRASLKTSSHPKKNEIKELKGLKTLAMFKGEIVHNGIADFIRDSYEAGSSKPPLTYFNSRWEEEERNIKNSLIEIRNNQQISEEQIKQAKRDCDILIMNFTELWHPFAGKEILYLDNAEKYANWFKCGQYGVYAKPDLIIKDDKYIVIDWKTGKELDGDMENDLQMSASVFLACFDGEGNVRKFPHEFEGYFYYLKTKSISEPAIKSLEDYKKFIVFIEKRMAIIPQTESVEEYPPDAVEWKCGRCQFASICADGRQFII